MGSQYDVVKDIKVYCQEECGNAPRKEILRQFNIALVTADIELLNDFLSDEVIWNQIGTKKTKGKKIVMEQFQQLLKNSVIALHIENIITHGSSASVNGYLEFGDQTKQDFCDVYRFVSAGKHAKMKEITSYRI
ncbi:DUF4440 domain-containing protein [Ornithinibacillus xuwenensis]|uniref:DUF4440 domain-containing protein n=1 Tax=Ornithinibacillus xuwenensis TaxID=3144668 RepID=A0ABU9XJK5_9BACI